jgi:hypothetical protein
MEYPNVFKLSQFLFAITKYLQFKPKNWNFDFIKILAQIINNFEKIWKNEK